MKISTSQDTSTFDAEIETTAFVSLRHMACAYRAAASCKPSVKIGATKHWDAAQVIEAAAWHDVNVNVYRSRAAHVPTNHSSQMSPPGLNHEASHAARVQKL